MLVTYVLQHMKWLIQMKDKSLLPGSRLPSLAQTSTKYLCSSSQIQTILVASGGDFIFPIIFLKKKQLDIQLRSMKKKLWEML